MPSIPIPLVIKISMSIYFLLTWSQLQSRTYFFPFFFPNFLPLFLPGLNLSSLAIFLFFLHSAFPPFFLFSSLPSFLSAYLPFYFLLSFLSTRFIPFLSSCSHFFPTILLSSFPFLSCSFPYLFTFLLSLFLLTPLYFSSLQDPFTI